MPTPDRLDRIWASLHEPRALTAVAVGSYLTAIVVGAAVLVLTITAPGEQARDLVLTTLGAIAIVAGVVGAPSAWTGRHHVEIVAALLMPIVGLLAVTDAAMVLTDVDPLRPRVALLAAYGGLCTGGLGVFRYTYLRHAGPYAPGRGPQLPEKRIVAACLAMDDQDLEALRRDSARKGA